MKKLFIFVVIVSVMAIMTSCTQEEIIEKKSKALSFNIVKDNMNKSIELDNSTFINSTLEIHVYSSTDNLTWSSYDYAAIGSGNVFYIKNDGAIWRTYKDKDCAQEFSLYAPSNTNLKLAFASIYNDNNGQQINVEWDKYPDIVTEQWTNKGMNTDDVVLGTGYYSGNGGSEIVYIQYKHAYSQITFSIQNNSTTKVVEITTLALRNINIHDTCKFDHTGIRWHPNLNTPTYGGNYEFVTATNPILLDVNTTEKISGLALCIPVTTFAFEIIHIGYIIKDINDNVIENVPSKIIDIKDITTEWLDGKRYNYNIVFDRTKSTAVDVSEKNWILK